MEAKSDTQSRLNFTNINEVIKCPNCDAKLKNCDMEKHCEEEVEILRKMQSHHPIENNGSNSSNENSEDRKKPWTVFQRVQRNRQSRLKRRKRVTLSSMHPCPVCNVNFSQDEIQQHTEKCLRRTNGIANGRDENSSNEDEDGDEYEEYEWAGQKRIRVSSLLEGGYSSIGVGQVIINHSNGQDNEEDEDLNVDEDDTHIYGPAQYGESDVIPPPRNNEHNSTDEGDITDYMRQLITGNTSTVSNVNSTSVNGDTANIIEPTACLPNFSKSYIPSANPSSGGPLLNLTSPSTKFAAEHYLQIIESLKCKLRHYENHVQNKFKCLICLDEYRNPAISVSCWHVHCEECWLRSLGARKLCPQCNLITSPKDLRRIYM